MDKQNFSPFYRTSSPIGAAALLNIHINYQILKQGKGTADHMMPRANGFLLSYFSSLIFLFVLGSGPEGAYDLCFLT